MLIASVVMLSPAFAQKEASCWYFGSNASVHFKSGNSANAPSSSAGKGSLNTTEGCSSIADRNGNLLLYTDGITVWNRNHTIMSNGTGLNGHSSSTQAAAILKQPGNSSIYYLFTTDQQAQSGGLCYSIVDMSSDHGLGGVTVKNTPLFSPSTEKVTVYTTDSSTSWAIAHAWNSNEFYCYRLDKNGLHPPVISRTGSVHTGGSGNPAVSNSVGYLKVSPDGRRLAAAIYQEKKFEVFEFDKYTGVISNPVELRDSVYTGAYGVEFSQDGRYLYGTFIGNSSVGSALMQFDLFGGSPHAIQKSKALIYTSYYPTMLGALQLSGDGRIYSAIKDSPYLAAIDKPSLPGSSCNYVPDAIYLNGPTCQLGLPNFSASYFHTANYTTVPAELGSFTAAAVNGAVQISWITLTEQNSDYFTLECSEDGSGYRELGRYEARNHSEKATRYTCYDISKTGRNATVYYRLSLTDNNGVVHTVAEMPFLKKGSQLPLVKNPVKKGEPVQLNLTGVSADCQVTVLDRNGQLIYRDTLATEAEPEVTLRELDAEPGIYFIQLREGGNVSSGKLVIH
jgi:6-phosphogluconolactonase (cycloisomerase 2 family)